MKFDPKSLLPILIISVLVVAVVGGAIYYKNQSSSKPIIRYKFQNIEFQFRDDLRLAQNVSVYPDEQTILNRVWDDSSITRVNIVYVPTPNASEENSMLSLGIVEIRYKLDLAYRQFDWVNVFTSTELESYDNIATNNHTLTIALVRPSLSDKTAVELKGDVIYIEGTTAKNFDLAVIKFLMSALEIRV